jgi:hypothetical protein
LVGMLEIRILNVSFSTGTWNSININDNIQNMQVYNIKTIPPIRYKFIYIISRIYIL